MTTGSGTETQPVASGRVSRPRVLSVERAKPIRDILVMLLFKDGYDCREAEEGRDAIDLLATGLRIDLVLSCLLMDIVDGFTLFLHVKQHYSIATQGYVIKASDTANYIDLSQIDVDILRAKFDKGRRLKRRNSAARSHRTDPNGSHQSDSDPGTRPS